MPGKICFVSLSSYPILAGKHMGTAGGAEVQQVFLARELVKHGFEVSFITYGNGEAVIEDIEGINVIKVYSREAASKLPFLSKARHVWKALRKASAALYLHRSGASGIVSIFCRLNGKKFILCISSDMNVNKARKSTNYEFYHKLVNWLDIKLADVVIAQSEFQRRVLKKNFGKESVTIKNAFPLPELKMPEKIKPPIVLWVGTIRDVKQPELFLKLADNIPEARFQMIGGTGENVKLYDQIKASSNKMPNIEFLGFVPFHEIGQYFKQASILVNTSEFEGFPNTFIQAWEQYTPIVSLNIDPDEVVCQYNLGLHSKTFGQLINDVKTLLRDERLRQQMGENTRRYVEREHNITRVVDKYIEIFNHKV